MNNRGVAIRYSDIAPEAKENFIPTASESEFDTLAQLQKYNLNFPNHANPCELYSVVLDGTATAFPSDPESANLGLWSEQISNDDGTFTEPIVLELESVGQYSSQGFTFTFDTYNNIYPTRLSIQWIRSTTEGITTLDTMEFTPDNALYFCRNQVENYNKVVITFYSLNMPKNRLKLRVIDYGYDTFFYGDELRNVKLIQEIDPISSEIIINTADFTLNSKRDLKYSFQAKQPLSIYFNGELKATSFVKSSKRKALSLWDIQSEDYIGLLDSIPYYGGIYTNTKAFDILADIFSVANVPYSIDEAFANETVTGYIPYTTCREALMQVAFAIQAVVDTSNVDFVNIYALDNEVKQTVPLDRIMQGQTFDDEETVTGVEIVAHAYNPITETIDVYDASENGTGENIFVKFSEPLHDLRITNGTIVSSGANYAIINANANSILKGQKYNHITKKMQKDNPIIAANIIKKIAVINNVTLISQYNIDNILDKCYNYLMKTNTINLKIVERKHISGGEIYRYGEAKYGKIKYGEKSPIIVIYDAATNIGDKIKVQTEYSGNLDGRIIKQTFNLNGGIVIKDCIVR